ncbi:trypsin-like serine peptidase [Vitreimonas flagellata]|uniref:trypsin-like serine peptidase n=1 Tax=Vitreimonas flagellata TaxID=2560861 RepID=UPI0010752A1D|nr:trypsin-like peptidase domain-containing protein [Vitreimonas flagellata]
MPKARVDKAFDGFQLNEDDAPSVREPKRFSPSFMVETNGGGSLERVKGFNAYRARNEGLPFFPSGGDRDMTPPHESEEFETELRDADEDGFRQENVIASDNRVPIGDTTEIPWRSIALLNITYKSGKRAIGTAWFIGPKTMATAAHNLHDPKHGRATALGVFPAFDGRAAPFGSVGVESVFFPQAWTTKWRPADDYGVLVLKSSIGNQLGWFGLADFDPPPKIVLANVCGYVSNRRPRTQYFNGGRIHAWTANFVEYPFDTSAGMSGAPVFYKNDREERLAIGIHTYGGATANRARRITGAAYESLLEYSQLGR